MNKGLKKGMSVVLAGAFMFSMSTAAFAVERVHPVSSDVPTVIDEVQALGVSQMYGTITNIGKEGDTTAVEVKFADKDETMVFYVSPETFVIDAATGLPMDLAGKENTTVSVYYGPAVTMSIPAKSPATAIIGNIGDDMKFPLYAKVEAASKMDNGDIKITTDNGSRIVTLPKGMDISPYLTKNIVTVDDVTQGAEVLLWYDIMTLSMPAQATAEKAVLLRPAAEAAPEEAIVEIPEAPAENYTNTLILSTQAGVAAINGQEIQVSSYVNANGEYMLPARIIGEALGYEVLWNDGTVTLKIKDGNRSVSYTVGATEYGINRMLLKLDSAPENKDGVTYIPVSFIEQALDTSVKVNTENV